MKTNMTEVFEKGLTLYQMKIFLVIPNKKHFPENKIAVEKIMGYNLYQG